MEEELQKIVSLTENLIRFRTTYNRPDERKKCADFIVKYFQGTGFKIRRFNSNGFESLFISKGLNKKPKVLLCGHFDVVDGEDAIFTPRKKGDKLFGRGAMDMKSGVAIFMYLMKELAKTKHGVGLLLVSDEEIGGDNGAKYMISKGYGGQIVLISDGGGRVENIVEKEKGMVRIEIEVEGKPTHASRPWDGQSAFTELDKIIHDVESLFVPLKKHPKSHWVDTCVLSKAKVGDAINSVPDYAMAHFDIRIAKPEGHERVLKKIKALLPRNASLKVIHFYPPTILNKKLPLVKTYLESVKHIGRKPTFGITHGSSDTRHFGLKNMSVIMSQPDGGLHHKENEWVSISAMGDYYNLVKHYLDNVAV